MPRTSALFLSLACRYVGSLSEQSFQAVFQIGSHPTEILYEWCIHHPSAPDDFSPDHLFVVLNFLKCPHPSWEEAAAFFKLSVPYRKWLIEGLKFLNIVLPKVFSLFFQSLLDFFFLLDWLPGEKSQMALHCSILHCWHFPMFNWAAWKWILLLCRVSKFLFCQVWHWNLFWPTSYLLDQWTLEGSSKWSNYCSFKWPQGQSWD